MTKLILKDTLTAKEQKKFGIPNSLSFENFNGDCYCMCICAIYKDRDEYKFSPEYSQSYISNGVKPNEVMSFEQAHKDIIFKEKTYANSRFMNIYYVKYSRNYKPTVVNDLDNFSENNIDVELIINENGYHRIEEVHIKIEPYTSVIRAIDVLFSNENIEILSFIKYEDGRYSITMYNDKGKPKEFRYNTLESIFDRITSLRLVGCKKI